MPATLTPPWPATFSLILRPDLDTALAAAAARHWGLVVGVVVGGEVVLLVADGWRRPGGEGWC